MLACLCWAAAFSLWWFLSEDCCGCFLVIHVYNKLRHCPEKIRNPHGDLRGQVVSLLGKQVCLNKVTSHIMCEDVSFHWFASIYCSFLCHAVSSHAFQLSLHSTRGDSTSTSPYLFGSSWPQWFKVAKVLSNVGKTETFTYWYLWNSNKLECRNPFPSPIGSVLVWYNCKFQALGPGEMKFDSFWLWLKFSPT